MALISLLLVIFGHSFFASWPENPLRSISQNLHRRCLNSAPLSQWQPEYQALVCGSRLPPSQLSESLRTTSLLHLAVVSGSHLYVLHFLFNYVYQFLFFTLKSVFRSSQLRVSPSKPFSIQASIALIAMGLYCLFTDLQPPVVRAFVALLIENLNHRFNLFWNGTYRTFVSGLATWAIFPNWIHSLSFCLSWAAGLALSLSRTVSRRSLVQHAVIYIVLMPVLICFAPTHPVGILCNWIIGPVIGAMLFPICLLAFAFPFIVSFTDGCWQTLSYVLVFIAHWIPDLSGSLSTKTPLRWLWCYLWLLHSCFHFRQHFQLKSVYAKKQTCISEK